MKDLEKIEEIIRKLEPEYLKLGEKITRRDFLYKTAVRIPIFLSLAGGVYTGTDYYNSASRSAKKILSEHTNMSDAELKSELEDFLQKLVSNRVQRHLEERMHSGSGRLKTISEMVINNEYNAWNDAGLQTAQYIRMILLASQILHNKNLYDYYIDFISSRTFEPGQGYRIFRIIDPLEEFVAMNKNLGKNDTVKIAEQLLTKCKTYILENYLSKADGLQYFIANLSEKENKIPLIRAESYFVVKHMREFASREYDSHMDVLQKYIIRDGLTYNRITVNNGEPIVLDKSMKLPDNVNIENGKFYSYAFDQVMMIDLFSDWYLATGKGHTTLKLLIDKYVSAVQTINKGQIIVFSPEYLFASQELKSINNLPYSFYTMIINQKPMLSTHTERRNAVISLINLMNLDYTLFRHDGVMPNARYEPGYTLTYMQMSDYFALRSIWEYIKK